MNSNDQPINNENLSVQELNEEAIKGLNPKIADAIRAILAERSGTEEIEWSDFSSHNKG